MIIRRFYTYIHHRNISYFHRESHPVLDKFYRYCSLLEMLPLFQHQWIVSCLSFSVSHHSYIHTKKKLILTRSPRNSTSIIIPIRNTTDMACAIFTHSFYLLLFWYIRLCLTCLLPVLSIHFTRIIYELCLSIKFVLFLTRTIFIILSKCCVSHEWDMNLNGDLERFGLAHEVWSVYIDQGYVCLYCLVSSFVTFTIK